MPDGARPRAIRAEVNRRINAPAAKPGDQRADGERGDDDAVSGVGQRKIGLDFGESREARLAKIAPLVRNSAATATRARPVASHAVLPVRRHAPDDTGRVTTHAERALPSTDDLLALFPPGSTISEDGTLVVGGCRLDDVADRFGTPAIVVSEAALRQRARDYLAAFRSRWPRADVAFASKSFPCTAVQRVMVDEGLHLDVAGAWRDLQRAEGGRRPGAGWCCTATPRPTRSSSWPWRAAPG